jgi:hypothetical protein
MMLTNGRGRVAAALGSGITGAVVLTTLHQGLRELVPDAPRMDVLGRRAIARTMRRAGMSPPHGVRLQRLAFAGDIAANTAYYAIVGVGGGQRAAVGRGLGLGLLAGLGAVFLPPLLGLGARPSRATTARALMTVALYAAGGLAAGLVFRRARRAAV